MTVASLKVRTSGDSPNNHRPEKSTALVARELARYNRDIAALSETRLPDEGQLIEVDAGYICLNHDNQMLALQLRAR